MAVPSAHADLTPPGYLDPTFGKGGIADLVPPTKTDQMPAGAVSTPDGGTVIASIIVWSTKNADIALTKLKRDGSFDTSFGWWGQTVTGIGSRKGPYSAVPADIVRQPDGKFLVAGTYVKYFNQDRETRKLLVVRFTRRGKLDRSYGTGGHYIGSVRTPRLVGQYVYRVAVDSKGRALIAADPITQSTRDDFAVVRLTRSGRADRSFGDRGSAVLKVAREPSYDVLKTILPLKDGSILLGGLTCGLDACNGRAVMARLTGRGKLDKSFGTRGVRRYRFGPGPTLGLYGNSIDDFAPQSGDKITAAATVATLGDPGTTTAADPNLAVVQFDERGDLDPTFGNGGISLETAVGSRENRRTIGGRILRDSDGRLYTAGARAFEFDWGLGEEGCLLQRFDPAGVFDSSWGHDGSACVWRTVYPSIEFRRSAHYSVDFGAYLTNGKGGVSLTVASSYVDLRHEHVGVLRFTK